MQISCNWVVDLGQCVWCPTYSTVQLLYNKKEYNLKMINIEAQNM